MKRLNLEMPQELFDHLQQVADENGTTIVELIRGFTKLGLIAIEIQKNPEAELLIRENEKEKQIIIL